jgi:hypothetical protein
VTEALAKYKALGEKAPADLKALEKATRQNTTILGSMKEQLSKIGPALLAAFSVGAVVAATKKMLDFADTMTNLSAKTGISTTGLQKLDLAFSKSGVSIDTVTQATTQLGARLVGDKGAVKLIGQLGLNIEALRRMKPEEQFLTVADAVGNIQNKGEQLFASKTLFGRGGIEILAGLTGNLKETTDEFERMGLIIDEETLKAADDFGDQLGVMGKQLIGVTAQIVGPLLPALSGLATMLSKVASVIGPLVGTFVDWAIKGVLAASAAIQRFIANLAEMATKIPILGKHLGIAGDYAKFLREQADATDARLVKMFTTVDEGSPVVRMAADELLGLGHATDEAGKAANRAAKWFQDLQEHEFEAIRVAAEENKKAMDAMAAKQAALQASTLTMAGGFDQWRAAVAAANHAVRGFDEDGLIPVNEDMMRLVQSTILGQHTIRALRTEAQESVGIFGSFGKSIQSLWEGMSKGQGFSGLFKNLGDSLITGFGNIISGGLTSVVNLAVEQLGKLAGKVWHAITGGPSEAEVQGRKTAADFTRGLEEELTSGQLAKVAELVSEGASRNWAIQAVAIQDAFIAAGKTAEEALIWVDKLWQAEKQGPEAVAAVMKELEPILDKHREQLEANEKAAQKAAGELSRMTEPFDILQEKIENLEAIDDIKEAFEKFRKSGTLDLKTVLREVERLHTSLGDNAALMDLSEAIRVAIETGIIDFGRLGAAWGDLEAMMRGGITIPIDFQSGGGGYEGETDNTGSGDRGGYLTPEEAAEAGVPWRPKDEFDWSDSAYRSRRDEDASEINKQAEENSFAGGTGGRYLNFGAGTYAKLHGSERVMTAAEGAADSASYAELCQIRRLLQDLPRALVMPYKTALIEAGYRY